MAQRPDAKLKFKAKRRQQLLHTFHNAFEEQKCLWGTHKILDTKTDQMKIMLIFPMINIRLSREGIRMEMVRCQTFPGSCTEWVPKHSGHGAQGSANSWFLALCFLGPSPEEGDKFSHAFIHLLFPQMGPFLPPLRSLPWPSRWKLSTCRLDLAESSSGFHLLPDIISKTQWHLTIQIWPPDSSLKLHKIAKKRLLFSQNKLLSGKGDYRISFSTCLFLLSHNSESLSHLVPK